MLLAFVGSANFLIVKLILVLDVSVTPFGKFKNSTALFTKPPSTVLPAVGMSLGDCTPLIASRHFQELYRAKPGMVLPAAL